MDNFSTRHGYKNVEEVEITIREDAPQEFREFLVRLLYDIGFTPTELRIEVCHVLRKAPDYSNWSDFPNVDYEIGELLRECDWFKVYDILEYILKKSPRGSQKIRNEVNDFFVSKGYGWKVNGNLIEMRGSGVFEAITNSAKGNLAGIQYNTASNELHQALTDLSRRPSPDTTGAIQHSMASLECIAREITGDCKATLGNIMSKNKELIPAPLDQAVEKAWGFASEYGRHIREGREPSFQDAELIVGICSAVGNYLVGLEKDNHSTKQQKVEAAW